MQNSILLKYGTDFERLSNILTDYCHHSIRKCTCCPFYAMLRNDESCPIDKAIGMINKIYDTAEVNKNDDCIPTCPF